MDIGAGDRAVDLMRASVASTARPEVIGGIGGFAGLFDAARLAAYRAPCPGHLHRRRRHQGGDRQPPRHLRHGRHRPGRAWSSDDLAACGAEPLFMTDYVVCGAIRPQRVAAIVSGVARGCAAAGCALLGGETAEHPGHLGRGRLRPRGRGDRCRGGRRDPRAPDRVGPGDTVIAMASSGLHSNGFSLVREILKRARLGLEQELPELGRPLGRGTAGPVAHLRPRLPGAGGALRRARVRAHHRRRPGRQPRPRPARRGGRGAGPRDLAPARDLRRAGASGRGAGRRDGSRVQHGRRHDRGGGPGRYRRGPGPAGRARRPRVGPRRDRPRFRRSPADRRTQAAERAG